MNTFLNSLILSLKPLLLLTKFILSKIFLYCTHEGWKLLKVGRFELTATTFLCLVYLYTIFNLFPYYSHYLRFLLYLIVVSQLFFSLRFHSIHLSIRYDLFGFVRFYCCDGDETRLHYIRIELNYFTNFNAASFTIKDRLKSIMIPWRS